MLSEYAIVFLQKKYYHENFILLFVFSSSLFSQTTTLFLKSGDISLDHDIKCVKDNINYHFMSFSEIPTGDIKEKINRLGIEFLEYIQ